MRTRVGLLAIVAAIAGWPAETAVMQQDASPALTVAYEGVSLAPGEVGVIVVRGSRALTAVEGTAFERPIRFWPVGAGQWHGFVSAGLETAPGRYDVDVRGTTPQGGTTLAATTIAVTGRTFETRRLKVASRFATPPAREADRIQQDAKVLAAVFAAPTPDRLWRGPFVPPVGGAATSSFGRLTLLNGRPNGRHQGADFRASTGTTVVAPNAGRVVLATDLYFAGNTVVIDHGLGLFSLFAHLSSTRVAEGDLVSRGAPIAEAGATGRVTGPHLHWAVRLEALSVDPLSLMAATVELPEPNDILATR